MTEALAGKRILVVEDEYYIATEIRRMLASAGAIVIGPVGQFDRGMLLADEQIDAAILDVNLETDLSYPIADRLRRRDIPYMFLTGYDGWSLPADYRDEARLAKPFQAQALVEMVETLVSRPRASRT